MVSMMRETIPELVLRTTMITGFPGETDEQFEDLVEFVDRMHFERLGVFTYSIEPDTPAARLDEHLPERIKKERRNRLMAVQQKNAFDWCAKQLGKKLPILIDKAVELNETPQKGKRGAQSIQQGLVDPMPMPQMLTLASTSRQPRMFRSNLATSLNAKLCLRITMI